MSSLFGPALACVGGTCVACTNKTCPQFDGSPPDADGDVASDVTMTCPSGLACEQCSLVTFTAPTMQATAAAVGACTPQEITSFVAACSGSTASKTACNTWQSQTANGCTTCLLSNATATSWGALVCDSGICLANQGGCIDLITNAVASEVVRGGKGSCGDDMAAAQACHQFACGTCADVDYSTCDESAAQNECKPYGDVVESTTGACAAILSADVPPANIGACFPHDDATDEDFANVFCGTGP